MASTFFKSVDSLFRFYGELTQLACPVQWAVPSLNPIIPSFPQDCQGGTPAGRLPAQDPRGQLPLSLHVSCKRWSQDYGGHSRSSAAKVENSLWIKKKKKLFIIPAFIFFRRASAPPSEGVATTEVTIINLIYFPSYGCPDLKLTTMA